MLIKRRKAQASGAAAATLVAIIAALIILYILALSPEEREKILEGEEGTSGGTSESAKDILLSESPGRLTPAAVNEFEKTFSPVTVFIGEEAVQLKKKDSLYIKSTLFSKKKESLTFEIGNLEDSKEVLLNFVVSKSKGRIIINLNGHEVYNNEVISANINPVNLKKEGYLQEGLNEIEFSVSSPGISFWSTNEYNLEEVTVSATKLTRDTQISTQEFVVTEDEKKAVDSLKLNFNAECEQANVGKLDILINDFNLFSAVPDCGQPNKPIEFLPTKLLIGENELKFKTSEGRYLLDHLSITSTLKEEKPKTYYFELKDEQYTDITNQDSNITLFMRFEDDISDKEGTLLLNGHKIDLDQTKMTFNTSIRNFVEKGTNSLKIVPDKILDIAELKVKLES